MVQARELLRLAAEQGYLEGEVQYAAMLCQGIGRGKDLEQALTYARRAAEKNNCEGSFYCGLVLAQMGESSKRESIRFFGLADSQGHPCAKFFAELFRQKPSPGQTAYLSHRLGSQYAINVCVNGYFKTYFGLLRAHMYDAWDSLGYDFEQSIPFGLCSGSYRLYDWATSACRKMKPVGQKRD